MSPKVSVIIPVKDCENTISRSISSVLEQSYNDYEVIVVDNNCSDKTIDRVKSFNSKKIRIIPCKTKGIVPALNMGVSVANGDYIARQDGDDYWYPQKLEKQVKLLNNNKNVHICGTQIRIVATDGEVVDDNFRYPVSDKAIKSWLLTGKNSIAHPSVIFRKDIFLRIGGYDDTYPIAEDHHLWLRCIKWFNFVNLPEVLLDYTSNTNPDYDPKFPLLASEAQFRVLSHMGFIKIAD